MSVDPQDCSRGQALRKVFEAGTLPALDGACSRMAAWHETDRRDSGSVDNLVLMNKGPKPAVMALGL